MTDEKLHRAFLHWLSDRRSRGRWSGVTWLDHDYLNVYVRASRRVLLPARVSADDVVMRECIDIANLITQPDLRGRGLVKSFLAHVEAQRLPIYIENVLADPTTTPPNRFQRFFANRPDYFLHYNATPESQCFYWLPPVESC
jgi:hypothetical protein